jgi:uncharacterized protein
MNSPSKALITGEALTLGRVSAPLISLAEPLSFWGGFDATTGLVTDRRHPDVGRCLSGAIVRMTAARGSSSGSSVLAEAIRRGTAPAGFIVRERDAILLLAALVAEELYATPCVIVLLDKPGYDALEGAVELAVSASQHGATVQIVAR